MTYECTEEQFLKDVKDHAMEVILDDGIYRHVRFSKPGTSCMHFDLVTWPGYLCYTGDMGTYVFTRLRDMFEFFRTDRQAVQRRGRQLGINLSYWSEKLEAVDGGRSGGAAKEFSADKFKRAINEYRVQWMRDAKESGTLDKEGRRELWEAVDDEVLRLTDDGEHRAQAAAYDFRHDPRSNPKKPYGWHFTDLFDNDFTEYTDRFTWCCYALAWGILQYDDAKTPAEAETA